MKTITKTPLFWILFAAASCAAIFFSYQYFPRAFPIIHLDITMDRAQAVSDAKRIAKDLKVGPSLRQKATADRPQDTRHATAFKTDDTAKTFVELEAGGKDAVVSMMEQNLYQLYTWQVRLFKPFEQNEVTVRFTPKGAPYGFVEKLSENESGTNVGDKKAHEIAYIFASSAPWNVDFSQYKTVEASQEKKAGGRVDHTIMYERTDEKIGEGFYRLKIVVSGDKVSELSHSVKVPDAFLRRYQEMRAANEMIAHWAKLIMMVLYMLGCLLIGLLFLFRKRWVIWRPAFAWAFLIAALMSTITINNLPLLWMNYNTALSPYAFLLQLGVQIIVGLIFSTAFFAAVFMAAESLTRRAFGNQLQFWHLFQPAVASSYTVLGYTVSAYLLVPICLAYGVLFYFITSHFFNWWTPSSSLFDPNVLASYFPWLTSIAISLSAGFSEECLFRAIPLASAALLGNRYGRRNWWIAGAFILQAVVFGAAHANYPAQPAYARLVELLVFSSVFGALYLKFGLLISIISHFVYDVFWFALPLFLSSAPYAWISKVAVIALAGIPLWIVGISRIKIGTWIQIPASLYNKAWKPSAFAKPPSLGELRRPAATADRPHTEPVRAGWFVIVGIIGLIGWAVGTRFQDDTPSFSTNRSFITRQATQTLEEKQIELTKWYPLVYGITQFEQQPALLKQHRFIWQQGGKDLYRQLISSYLSPQQWIARFVTWNGDVTERSEEHHLFFLPDGTMHRYAHKLPEATPGASLSKAKAQEKALEVISSRFDHTKDQLKEIGAVATKQPERLDWKVTYASKNDYPLNEGEAHLEVLIAGDEVVDSYRYIHVPEQWERTYENKQAFANIITTLSWLLVYLLLLACAFLAFTRWQVVVTQGLLINVAWLTVLLTFALFNGWPSVGALLNTSQSFFNQIFRMFSISTIIIFMQATLLAVMISLVTQMRSAYRAFSSLHAFIIGTSLGTLLAGAIAFAQLLIGTLSPTWAYFVPIGTVVPFINGVDSQILTYVSLTINLLLFVIICDMVTDHWKLKRWAGIGIFLIAGFARAGLINSYNMPLFALNGLLISIIMIFGYLFAWRFDRSILPIATGTYMILQLVQQIFFNAYPYAIAANLVAIIIIAAGSWYWHRQMQEA